MGKTKIIEELDAPNLIRIRTKDSLTANDGALNLSTPLAKDKTSQTVNVFALLRKYKIPIAFKSRNDETSFIAEKCRMIPMECVIRRQPYGSYLKRHPERSAHELFPSPEMEFFHKFTAVAPCTIHKNQQAINPEWRLMPEERARELFRDSNNQIINQNQKVFPDPFIMPTNNDKWHLFPAKKPEVRYLMEIYPLVTEDELEYIKNKLMKPTFEVLEKAWKVHEVNLIDLKVEVGYGSESGELMVADVIDNDSWRIWPRGNPRNQLDKQSFRDGEELNEVEKKYKIVTEYTRKLGGFVG